MLSKEMDFETTSKQSVKTEKKRKKENTPKSSKKQKLDDSIEANKPEAKQSKKINKKQSKYKPNSYVLELAKHIEDQYVIPDYEQTKLDKLLDNLYDYTEKLSEEERNIEEIKERLLYELEEEKSSLETGDKGELIANESYQQKLDVVEAIKKIEDKHELERKKTIHILEKRKAKNKLEEMETDEKTTSKSKDDKVINTIKEKLLNELENEELRIQELNEALILKHNIDVEDSDTSDEETQKEEQEKNVINKIKEQLLNELENEELRIQELNEALVIKHNLDEVEDSEDETEEQEIPSDDGEVSSDDEEIIENIKDHLLMKVQTDPKVDKVERKHLAILKAERREEKRKQLELTLAEKQNRLARKQAKKERREAIERIKREAKLEEQNIEIPDVEEPAEKEPVELTEEQLKKIADFDAKKFRQSLLNKQTCYTALQDFNELCSFESANRDFALEYLESGGSTSEIISVIEIVETKSSSFVLPIVEALTTVCFKIISAHPQKQLESEESCREFINKHYSVVKSMMALNASSKQRKSALKMLSVIVSLSATTAKEVLSHAVFDPAVLELLYQPSNIQDGTNVRTYFIHFLMSFLADGHSPVIIAFLEKRALLTSIIPGLVYDTVEIVNLVLSMMQAKILEDRAISKTAKMNFFNTHTIETIVNVFNWKGPRAWNPKKRKQIQITPDPAKLTNVCEILQKFLTCLCATKQGIIFFDPSVGLSPKKCNPLLMSVLSNLRKPWMNPYKRELVVKICVACPDVFRSVLAGVEEFLEPRLSDNWLTVVHFVTELIESLNPAAIEPSLVKLHNKQFALVMQHLCVPHSVLAKITDGLAQKDMGIRHECVNLLNIMLNSAHSYIKFVGDIPGLNENTIKGIFSGYLGRHLPPGSVLLKDWYKSIKAARFDASIDQQQLNVYLTKLLDVLYQYNMFCPGLIENITQEIDVKQFLRTIDVLSKKDTTSYDLHIKAINLLTSCDITIFAPSKEFFPYAVPLLFKFYYHTKGDTQIVIENMLFILFKLTSIFDCCLDEIMMWLYSILEQPNYDESLVKVLTNVLVKTHNDFLKYSYEMTSLKEQLTEGYDYRVIIENLSLDKTKSILTLNTQSKHRILSPFILGFLDLLTPEQDAPIKSYANVSLMNLLHYQTNPTILLNIVLQEKYSAVVGSKLRKYMSNIKLTSKISMKKELSPEDTVPYKLMQFLTKDDISTMPQLIDYCSEHSKYYTKTIMTNLIMFYFTQKSAADSLTTNSQTKCYELLLHIINTSNEKHLKYCLKSILDHPVMLDSFNPVFINTESNKLATKLITDIIKELLKTKTNAQLGLYLCNYQSKLVEELYKLLVNYSENSVLFQLEQLMDTLQLFDLSHDNCTELLDILSKIPVSSFKTDKTKSSVVLKLQSFILGHESNYSNFKPFSNEILKQINQQMIELNNSELNLEELELNLYNYLKQFPHIHDNFDSRLFESLITKLVVSKSSARLAAILLQNNHKYLEIFTRHLDKIYEKRELVFSLVNCIMDVKTDPSIKSLLENVYKQYEQIIMKYLNKPQKAANYLVENYPVIMKLVGEQLKPESCKEFCAKNHKFDSTEIHHFETLTMIFNKVILGESSEDLKQKYITNYVTTAMNLLINLLKRANKTEDDWNKGEKVAKHFCTYIIKIKNVYKMELKEEKLYSGAVFQTFAKLCLKFGLQEKPILVNVLRHLCALTSDQSDIADLGGLFEMAISHSESLNILLSDDEKKAPLLGLLLAICRRCKSCMVKSHIPIWLSAYEATLSESDQCLLQLLSMYESANVGFHAYRPYLWGKAAVAHYSVRSSIESTLWRQPHPREVLELFNENRIIHTIQHFPWARRLQNSSLYR